MPNLDKGMQKDKPESQHPATSSQIYIFNIRSAESKHLCYFKWLSLHIYPVVPQVTRIS